jgi:excisionase family DNA binding protein
MTKKSGAKKQRLDPRREVSRGSLGYSVEQVGRLLGISKSSAYAGVASGDIPSVRVGHLLIVPRDRFHEKFGALPESTAAA